MNDLALAKFFLFAFWHPLTLLQSLSPTQAPCEWPVRAAARLICKIDNTEAAAFTAIAWKRHFTIPLCEHLLPIAGGIVQHGSILYEQVVEVGIDEPRVEVVPRERLVLSHHSCCCCLVLPRPVDGRIKVF